jgi:hypothetical protein
MINDPLSTLKELEAQNAHLQQDVWRNDIKRFAANFEQQFDFTIEFKPLAEKALIQEAQSTDATIQSICERKFRYFEQGLSIIHRNSGQTVFKLGKLAIEDPDRELSKWVVRSVEHARNHS